MAAATSNLADLLRDAAQGACIAERDALEHLPAAALAPMMVTAEALTLIGFGQRVSYSRKVFIPLTQLCRDVCHYCTFAHSPRNLSEPYLSHEQVLALARAGEQAGCKEALFTLGDKPELRYRVAREGLASLGAASTLEYLERMARTVLEHTGLLPHLNPGLLTPADLQRLRPVAASMGLMLESSSPRLCARGGPHFGSPDKLPERRLATLRAAGELGIAMTTGLLIGIGESRLERIESLLLLRRLHQQFGHLQELIIQNFKPKIGTRMATVPEASLEEQLWTIAVARLLFGPGMSIQAPPNLRRGALECLIRAGINDWGGVSPVTPDHVNPEAPWPQIAELAASTAAAGRQLVERLALVPSFAREPERWTDPQVATRIRRLSDSRGCARSDGWFAGAAASLPSAAWQWIAPLGARHARASAQGPGDLRATLDAATRGQELAEHELTALFDVEGEELQAVLRAADELRARTVGDEVTFVVNRNINYTNICSYHCGFCAFSKGRSAATLRGPGYNLELDEVARRTREAADAGATEVCLQGGIHPSFTGDTYLGIVAAVREAAPNMHVHAFSALEIRHGAATLGLPLLEYLERLKAAGLSTLPGTAAEILDDEVRAVICPDKLTTQEWLSVIASAHRVGLRTTATIMFGHVEGPRHWARHLLQIRRLQAATSGITEFVPLPFVHMEAPLWRRGRARSGPTLREALLMHAIARLALHPLVTNIQASWVKMGPEGLALCLNAGANDMGGTLMNESITRAAGGVNGQQFDSAQMRELARRIGRPVRQRNTLYGSPPAPAVLNDLEQAEVEIGAPIKAWEQVGCAEDIFARSMLRLGYKASAEQFAPSQLLEFALLAEQRGFDSVFISDHFQPWRHEGGHAPFSLAWLGALGACSSRLIMGTSVLTPTFRYRPAIVAQAFATLGCMYPGRVILGLGSGESLNEVPAIGIAWPEQKERTARFKEAVRLIRALWTQERLSFDGRYYRTLNATIYDRPTPPPPLYVAAAGPVLAKFAGEIADGFICTSGKGESLYRDVLVPNVSAGIQAASRDAGAVEMTLEVKVSFDTDAGRAREDTRHWAVLALSPEEKSGVDDPLELQRLADALPAERTAQRWIVSSDPDEQVEKIRPYVALGFRHLVFHAPGADQGRFIELYAAQVLPRLRRALG